MPTSIKQVLYAVLEEYELSFDGIHGVNHWARVFENGLRLAEQTGADIEIVKLFAVLHDSKRINDGHDPEHGPRAASFAAKLRGEAFELTDSQFHILQATCAGHTNKLTHPDITVQTCFDADRLDLSRIGITPHPNRLCTDFAKKTKTINWAVGRGSLGYVPDFVRDVWSIG